MAEKYDIAKFNDQHKGGLLKEKDTLVDDQEKTIAELRGKSLSFYNKILEQAKIINE